MKIDTSGEMLKKIHNLLLVVLISMQAEENNSKIYLLIIFASLITKCDGEVILGAFPVPSISHQRVFRTVTKELAKCNHQLKVITTDPAFERNESYMIEEIDVHNVSYEIWKKEMIEPLSAARNDIYDMTKIGLKAAVELFVAECNTKEVVDALERNKFDLIVAEANARPVRVLSYILETSQVLLSSLGGSTELFESFGSPTNPCLYPDYWTRKFNKTGLIEKIMIVYEDMQVRYLQWNSKSYEDAMLQNITGKHMPNTSNRRNIAEMLFLNVHPIWDNNRPVPPLVKYVSGIYHPDGQELPQNLKNLLENSANSVIYMSFGNNVKTSNLPKEKIKLFNRVFSKLPYNILWKWDDDEMEGKASNVYISKWFPQLEILGYPNIKLFITQGGLQSTEEAILCGVPLLAFPMIVDQWLNAEFYEKFKIGLKLDFGRVDENTFEQSVEALIHDESYRKNIRRLSAIMKDQPQPALERTIWWIEYILRHGSTKHLRGLSMDVSWTEYLLLDVIAVFAVISFTAATLFMRMIRTGYKFMNKQTTIIF